MFFTFPEDARWNAGRQAGEFGVEIGEYRGVVRVPRRVFQRRLPQGSIPEISGGIWARATVLLLHSSRADALGA